MSDLISVSLDFSSYHAVTKLSELYNEGIIWRVTDSHVLDAYRTMNGVWQHIFCPDCAVFLGRKMFVIEGDIDVKSFNEFVEKHGKPVVIEYKGCLYIHAASVKKAMEIQSVLSFSAQVTIINKCEDVKLLSEKEIDFLLNWDAEKYRKTL